MLRISNLIRGRIIPFKSPLRAGLPNWQRPDPPPSAVVPLDHQLTDQEIVFNFFDGSMPQFFLTQPQVYQGDTLLEATPSLLKGIGMFLLTGVSLTLLLQLFNPTKPFSRPSDEIMQLIQYQKQQLQQKNRIQWINQNPVGLTYNPEAFARLGYSSSLPDTFKQYERRQAVYDSVTQQTRQYLQGLKEKAQKIVEARKKKAQQHLHHEHIDNTVHQHSHQAVHQSVHHVHQAAHSNSSVLPGTSSNNEHH